MFWNVCPRIFRLFVIVCLFLLTACAKAKLDRNPVTYSATGNAIVSSDHPAASRIGITILQQGGNAFDAAVAVQFGLAVAYPGAGNIGGGGFAVMRTADGRVDALDFRERAPLAASRNMYLDPDGDIIPRLSLDGHLAVGVPGSVDGMVQLHQRYGRLQWQQIIQPALDLARNGFALTPRQAEKFNRYQEKFIGLNRTKPALVRSDRKWMPGDLLVQDDLAATLERIRDAGRAGFYAGETARLLVEEMQASNGLMTTEDLETYRAIWRRPVTGTYHGYQIISMPPPSSGGIALLQILYGLSPWPLNEWKGDDWRRVHVKTEIERLVYADRAVHLGDPDFASVPVGQLLSDFYLQSRFANVSLQYRTPSSEVEAGTYPLAESSETTHFSVVDAEGNAVAITTTLNGSFGSKVVVSGAGFFLNNEMDDFSSKPGEPNQFGLVGGEANAIEPGKRMLSSMTPTIVEKDDKLFLVVGSPGGSTIITTVAQVISNVIDRKMSLSEAVAAPRVHHQWLPDLVFHEPDALTLESIVGLDELGHELKERKSIGRVNAIMVLPDGRKVGVHDVKRGDGLAAGF